jgi:hypothetical protein
MRHLVTLLAVVDVSEEHAASTFRVEDRDVFLRNFGRTARFHNPKDYLYGSTALVDLSRFFSLLYTQSVGLLG